MTVTKERPVVMIGKATTNASIDETIDRMQSEYREMPGLRLTFDQMRRLWTLDRPTCRILLEKLVGARFLMPTSDGQYLRCDSALTRQRERHQEV
jgi:hypothetical protein